MTTQPVTGLAALLLLSGWSLLAPFLQPDAHQGREGLRSYDRSAYADAVERFARAREARPDGRYDFDLGAAAYRAGDFPIAGEAFGAARRSPDLPSGRADFNLGNARYKVGDLEGALAAYRAALRADPSDEDARANVELALRKLEAARQEQNQSEGQKQDRESKPRSDDSQRAREDPDSTRAREGDRREEEQQPQDQAQSREDGSQQEAGEQSRPPAEPERLLSPEQAAQLLDQVAPEERELLEARLKAARRRPAEKDW